MNGRKWLNNTLIAIAILSPAFFYLGNIMIFIPEGCHSDLIATFFKYFGITCILGAGPVGCIAILTVLIAGRKKFKLIRCLGLLTLLLLCFCHILPFHRFVASHLDPSYHYIEYAKRYNGQEKVYLPFTEKNLKSIESQLGKPVSLHFEMCYVSDNDIANLSDKPCIRDISIDDCPNITDNIVQVLSRFPRLKSIALLNNPQLKNPDFSLLADLKKLKIMALNGSENLSEDSLNSIFSLSRLETLRVESCGNITDDFLSGLTNLSKLKDVSLRGCPSVTSKGIEKLQNLPITSLSLPGNLWNDEAINSVIHFKNLTNLYLEENEDETAPHLSDVGFTRLGELKKMNNLYIYYSKASSISSQGILSLKKENPKCKIEWLRVSEKSDSNEAAPETKELVP